MDLLCECQKSTELSLTKKTLQNIEMWLNHFYMIIYFTVWNTYKPSKSKSLSGTPNAHKENTKFE